MYGMHQMLAAFDSVLCASTQLSLSSRWWCPGPDDGSLAETNFHVMQNVLVQWLLTTLRGHEAHSRLVSSEGRQ